MQQVDGSWFRTAPIRTPLTLLQHVAMALAELSERAADDKYACRKRNLDWFCHTSIPAVLDRCIDLKGHPDYLHFIAYVLQAPSSAASFVGAGMHSKMLRSRLGVAAEV